MRIISGNFKGKKILEPNDKSTRPLKDLTKEALFNIILHSNKFDVKIPNMQYLRFIFWCWVIWLRMFIKRCLFCNFY